MIPITKENIDKLITQAQTGTPSKKSLQTLLKLILTLLNPSKAYRNDAITADQFVTAIISGGDLIKEGATNSSGLESLICSYLISNSKPLAQTLIPTLP